MLSLVLLSAAASVNGCPDSIHDNQLVAPVAGFQVAVDTQPRRLERVVVYAGPPQLNQKMKSLPGANRSQVWHAAGQDVWVECHYHESSAVLTRDLGKQASCTFRAPKGEGAVSFGKFECE